DDTDIISPIQHTLYSEEYSNNEKLFNKETEEVAVVVVTVEVPPSSLITSRVHARREGVAPVRLHRATNSRRTHPLRYSTNNRRTQPLPLRYSTNNRRTHPLPLWYSTNNHNLPVRFVGAVMTVGVTPSVPLRVIQPATVVHSNVTLPSVSILSSQWFLPIGLASQYPEHGSRVYRSRCNAQPIKHSLTSLVGGLPHYGPQEEQAHTKEFVYGS
ncbi:unnamed protein product, partial [Timema podura]|nr:unnamed protein product [Timema podura]